VDTYFYWIHGYWRYASIFISKQQSDSPKRYTEFKYLHNKTWKVEIHRHGPINESEWDDFLDLEAAG
jgi:hypothetical protein